MRFQSCKRIGKAALPILLAAVMPILLAVSAGAQEKPTAGKKNEVTLTVGNMIVELQGPGWKLRYGSTADKNHDNGGGMTNLATASDGRVWFSHGGWLRLIDPQKGMVIGRWHFTDLIKKLEPRGDAVEVTYAMQGDNFNSTTATMLVSPATPHIAFQNPNNLLLARVSSLEGEQTGEFSFGIAARETQKRDPEKAARKLLPFYEDRARRDPLSPFIQAAYATLLKEAGDPKATGVLARAIKEPTSDFTELFPLSAYLDSIDEPVLAREAFESAYRDYLDRGNDPRLFHVLITRLVLYPMPKRPVDDVRRAQLVENIYRLAPNMEAAYLGWEFRARELDAKGDSQGAALWRQRALESRENEIGRWQLRRLDWALLLCLGSLVGSTLLLIVQWAKYRPQRKLDVAKRLDASFAKRIVRNLSYWTTRERYALALMVALSWYALGSLTVIGTVALRVWSSPINVWSGSFAPPPARQWLEQLPDTSARNLLLALSHQQAGDDESALRIYLGQPQYAQAWNNLGVIYRHRGQEAKAKEAFRKALEVDPGLNEAKLNLGMATDDFWTSQYRQILPGRPMLAIPTAQQVREAYMGTSSTGIYLRALAGPFAGKPNSFAAISNEGGVPTPILWLGAVLLALTLSLVFLVPHRTVTEAPPRWLPLLEGLAPGSARRWGWAGGMVLAWFGLLVVAALITWRWDSPLMLHALSMPGIERAYSVSVPADQLFWVILAWGKYVLLIPMVLFVINLAVCARDWRASH